MPHNATVDRKEIGQEIEVNDVILPVLAFDRIHSRRLRAAAVNRKVHPIGDGTVCFMESTRMPLRPHCH
jgi:hypothetical protein